MKSKYLNKIPLIALVCASYAVAGEFNWPGDDSLLVPDRENAPVLVTEGPGVRSANSLRFDNETNEGGKEGAQFLRLSPLPLVNASNELTIACFAHPERRKANENIIASKSDNHNDWNGYRLFKVWDKWGLEIGDGGTGERIYSDGKLTMNTWQHLAVVIRDRVITFYQDGIPVGKRPLKVESVAIPSDVIIGAAPNGYLPFQGMITGIYLSDKALDENGILDLIRSVTE